MLCWGFKEQANFFSHPRGKTQSYFQNGRYRGGARNSEQERGDDKEDATSNESEQSVGESQRGECDSSELENTEVTPCTS